MISENVLIYKVREPLGNDSIVIVAKQVKDSNAGYKLKFASSKTMDSFLRRAQMNLMNAECKPFRDRKTDKGFVNFKFKNDVTYPYTPAIKIKLSGNDETLADYIFTNFLMQAANATSNVKRGLEHGILSK